MDGFGSLIAEAAALLATALAVIAAVPQLHRVIARHDCRGVSASSAALGVGTELAWVAYATCNGLRSALPEAIAMASANTLLVLALIRHGVAARPALRAGTTWIASLIVVAVLGGARPLGVVLGISYAVQVAPAVWTAWTTPSPTGVATATWSMIGLEGLLWGIYAAHHTDPAMISFAIMATLAATAMLTRKLAVAHRAQRSERSPRLAAT